LSPACALPPHAETPGAHRRAPPGRAAGCRDDGQRRIAGRDRARRRAGALPRSRAAPCARERRRPRVLRRPAGRRRRPVRARPPSARLARRRRRGAAGPGRDLPPVRLADRRPGPRRAVAPAGVRARRRASDARPRVAALPSTSTTSSSSTTCSATRRATSCCARPWRASPRHSARPASSPANGSDEFAIVLEGAEAAKPGVANAVANRVIAVFRRAVRGRRHGLRDRRLHRHRAPSVARQHARLAARARQRRRRPGQARRPAARPGLPGAGGGHVAARAADALRAPAQGDLRRRARAALPADRRPGLRPHHALRGARALGSTRSAACSRPVSSSRRSRGRS